MAISNINTNTSSSPDAASSIFGNAAAAAAIGNAQNQGQQVSTVVSISKQAQVLNRAGNNGNQNQQTNQLEGANNNVNNQVAEKREPRPGEASEKPGIQLLEGEKNNTPAQGTRVNTYV